MVVWHLNSCIFCCQVSAWVMFDDLVRSANQSCCWNSCSPGASGSVNIDAFFFQICYQSAIDSEWKCVHLWMALSTIKTTAFRSCSAAFWHNSQHIRAERETYVKKIPMESLWDSGLENTKEELIWNDSTDDMAPSQAHQLGSGFQYLQSEMVLVFTCLSVFPAKPIITAIIPVREMSTANTPSLEL